MVFGGGLMQLVLNGSQDILRTSITRYTREVYPIVVRAMEAISDDDIEKLKRQCTILDVCMKKARHGAKIYE